jgi:prevent-host-death family protein
MRIVNIHTAKTNLSMLIEAVEKGEEVIIARAGRPIVRLESLSSKPKVKFGVLKGKLKIAHDFDGPLPDNVLNDFES